MIGLSRLKIAGYLALTDGTLAVEYGISVFIDGDMVFVIHYLPHFVARATPNVIFNLN